MSINEVSAGAGKNVRCFTCNTVGHIAPDCPTREELQGDSEIQCFNCKGFGHKSTVCPNGDSYPLDEGKSPAEEEEGDMEEEEGAGIQQDQHERYMSWRTPR